jgi:hypothetical protein
MSHSCTAAIELAVLGTRFSCHRESPLRMRACAAGKERQIRVLNIPRAEPGGRTF